MYNIEYINLKIPRCVVAHDDTCGSAFVLSDLTIYFILSLL